MFFLVLYYVQLVREKKKTEFDENNVSEKRKSAIESELKTNDNYTFLED